MKKILVYNYCLSVFFARGKKELFKKGTWFLFANELFFLLVSLAMFVVTRLDFILSDTILLMFLLGIWAISFYVTKSWLMNQLDTNGIVKEYDSINHKGLNASIGLILFVGSFIGFIIVGILTFEGYSQ